MWSVSELTNFKNKPFKPYPEPAGEINGIKDKYYITNKTTKKFQIASLVVPNLNFLKIMVCVFCCLSIREWPWILPPKK